MALSKKEKKRADRIADNLVSEFGDEAIAKTETMQASWSDEIAAVLFFDRVRRQIQKQARKPVGVTVFGKVIRETEKALLFDANGDDGFAGQAWFPKSCTFYLPAAIGFAARLTIPNAMAQEKLEKVFSNWPHQKTGCPK